MYEKKENLGKNSEAIQMQNRVLVMKLLRDYQGLSRVKLAELTGLKQATITNIINSLLEKEYVLETGLMKGDNKRRVKRIVLNEEKFRVIVGRITDKYYAVGMYDIVGNCINVEKTFWNNSDDFETRALEVKETFWRYMTNKKISEEVVGVGLVAQGNVVQAVEHNSGFAKQGFEKYLHEFFSKELGTQVYVGNASNMSAYYEWQNLKSNFAEVQTLLCLMVGDSVDCSVLFEGKVVTNNNGRNAHFGHVSIDYNGPLCECGNRGCIKNYISVDAIKKRCMELAEIYPMSKISARSEIRDIIFAYYESDVLAVKLMDEVAEKLSVILANLINQFSPDKIIIGDELPNNSEFLKLVKSYTKKRVLPKRYDKVVIDVFKEERKTSQDVSLKGMAQFVINEKLSSMPL